MRASVFVGTSDSRQLVWLLPLLLVAGCTATGECRNPTKPSVVRQEGPKVPPGFWDSHKEGTVHLKVRIGRDGSVLDERVVSSSGHDYSVVAFETVKKWQYRPALCDGYAIDFDIDVTIRFARE